jgi:cobalt-precorrin 5A hydrolase / precorrin-3B C17-methyltransferase
MRLDLEIEQTWQDLGWKLGVGNWQEVKKVINQGSNVEIFQDCGSIAWRSKLPQNQFLFDFPEIGEVRQVQARVWIGYIQRRFAGGSDFPKAQWHPPVIWLGIGLRREVSGDLLSEAIESICRSHHIAQAAIAGIATSEHKVNHPAILTLVEKHNWQLKSYSVNQLDRVDSLNKSNLVRERIGTASVAEAAAILATNQLSLLVTKTNYADAITLAIAQSELNFGE